jgi:hypothetical protein
MKCVIFISELASGRFAEFPLRRQRPPQLENNSFVPKQSARGLRTPTYWFLPTSTYECNERAVEAHRERFALQNAQENCLAATCRVRRQARWNDV